MAAQAGPGQRPEQRGAPAAGGGSRPRGAGLPLSAAAAWWSDPTLGVAVEVVAGAYGGGDGRLRAAWRGAAEGGTRWRWVVNSGGDTWWTLVGWRRRGRRVRRGSGQVRRCEGSGARVWTAKILEWCTYL